MLLKYNDACSGEQSIGHKLLGVLNQQWMEDIMVTALYDSQAWARYFT